MKIRRISDLAPELQQLITEGVERAHGLNCPRCHGGRTGEKKLSLYRRGASIVLKCYRAQCGFWARLSTDPKVLVGPWEFKGNPFRGELAPLSQSAEEALYRKYRLTPQTLHAFRVTRVLGEPAIYMPVWSYRMRERGGMVRYFDGRKPKARAYKNTDDVFMAWYPHSSARTLVIVEDQLSAMRVFQIGMAAVALLGTTLSEEKADEIGQLAKFNRTRHVLLALDRDAHSVAVKYARQYRGQINGLKVAMLNEDLKDVSDKEIKEKVAA